ncbi:hypothetical protein AVEN_264477-1 [Araneus ventricosus]|uniref:Uncharacterized protein n=1 Tax=Araneus ventricosus TaxID=182803 RepID=A0A4Y2M143_ARAVE|nr:hypothetical protein AVEN_264477-1 [Araneus ventricosus]
MGISAAFVRTSVISEASLIKRPAAGPQKRSLPTGPCLLSAITDNINNITRIIKNCKLKLIEAQGPLHYSLERKTIDPISPPGTTSFHWSVDQMEGLEPCEAGAQYRTASGLCSHIRNYRLKVPSEKEH